MRSDPGLGVHATGIRGPVRLEDVLFTAQKSNRIAPLQVVRADRVVGWEHVRSAGMHALRAEREGRMQAKSVEVEFVRYLAGERQIRVALEKMGVPDRAEAAVVVGLGPKGKDAVQHFLHALGPKEDDGALDASEAKLDAFGITATQRAATTPGWEGELVLEAVALVDLMK